MKKICFLSGDMSRSGGTERVLAIIANELCKKEDLFEIHILSTVNENMTSFFPLDKRIKQSRILNDKALNFKKQYFKVVKGIRNYVKKNNIDVFIDVEVISSIFSIPATRFTSTKHIAWEHFNFYENNGSSLRTLARKIDAKCSDYIITLTEEDKNNYLKNLKIKGKIDYIYNPMESVEIKNCNINSKQIVSVGRLTYQKGFDILCDVAKDVLSKNPDYKWIILGDGEDKEKLQSKIKEYNLQDRLILKGKVSNVEDYYENSALYVMTSRFEGLPMTLLEAKNHKLPIVSFDCPTGPSEIIRNNVNGYLVKANDIKEMSNKVNSVLQDDKKLKEFSDKAELDIDKFNINSIIDKWTSLLVSI